MRLGPPGGVQRGPQAATRLTPGGWLLIEFGYGQGAAVSEAAAAVDGLTVETILKDLQGHERTLVAHAS